MRYGSKNDKKEDGQAKVNEWRISEELALRAMTGAAGPILTTRDKANRAEFLAAKNNIASKRNSRFYQDLEPILSLKCDVSVLSTYKEVFLFMDVLFKTRLWSASEDEINYTATYPW